MTKRLDKELAASAETRARGIIRRAFEAHYDADQDGYFPDRVVDGRFVHNVTLRLSADEANTLAAFASLVPKAIESLGACDTCLYSKQGSERGYAQPCLTCKRPRMSNWKAKFSPTTQAAIEKRNAEVTLQHKCTFNESTRGHIIFRGDDFWCSCCGAEYAS